MKFIDLFSGIGGFRLVMESVGHECIGFCEIDKFARESYKSIFQTEGEIEFHDIRDVSDDEFKKLRGKVDVICGGFPCQAFSIAGRRLGFEDTRGTLFFEIARAAKQIQPRFLFLENVKGLLNHDKGRTFTTILTTLDELGFDVGWQVLNSKDFGVPQNRERVFIIGHSRKKGTRLLFPFRREGQATNSEILKTLGNLNPSKSGMSGKVYYSEGLAPTLVRGKGEGFKIAIPCMTPDRLDKRQNGRRFKENQEPMFTLNTQDRHGIVVVGDLPTSFNEDTLTMSYRFGYYALEGKPTFQNYIILEAKLHQIVVAPMDGVVSLDGDNVILTNGKGENESRLTLFNIANGRAIEGTRVLAGDAIGETKDETELKITYQKYKDKKDKLTFVNPQFNFPKVIQLQTTILPTIGQFGGDEFAKAKAIYEYLKAKGASPQAIAAILGNWSVESSINPKRAEGDYLSPPVGASDGSWDDENWLAMGGPAIYGGGYPNIFHRGLGLGQWTDTADGSVRHTALVNYAHSHNKKWYEFDLQLNFMLHGDNPYYTNWLKDFFGNTGSPASLAQLFLTYWEGNSGDKLLERQTRATEWYYQIEKGFSQPNGGTAQSDSKALESVRGELYDNSIPGGGDGRGYAYGQCTWGVAARINQLGLKLKGRNGEKIPIINTMGNGQDWVATAASLGGETGSTPRAGAIISFVGGSHGTLTPYGHVSFVEKVYPDGSLLVSETNVNGNQNYTLDGSRKRIVP